MNIGALRKRLEFQAPAKTSDGMGGFLFTWTTMFTVWGALWPLRGEEAMAAMQAGGTVTHTVRIRYRTAPIKVSWRIKHGEKYLNIAGAPVNLGGENRWLEMKVKEVA